MQKKNRTGKREEHKQTRVKCVNIRKARCKCHLI